MRFLILSLVIAALFFLRTNPSFAASPTFGPNILVSDAVPSSVGSSDGPPILDVDIAGGVYVAWIDHRSGPTVDVFFSKLTSDGSSFSANKPLSGIYDLKSFPQIEEDGGIIYIAWNEHRIIGSPAQQGIFFTKSTDGGSNFTEELFVDSSDELPISMVAHDGKIYIVYSKGTAEIWLASSFDGGAAFTKKKISDSSVNGRQRPAMDFANSNVYVFWLDARNAAKYEVFFTKSSDNGITFDPNKSVYSNPNSGIHLLGNSFGRMSMDINSEGAIFLAFDFYLQTPSPFTTDYEVYFIKSIDGGGTFSSAKRLSDDPTDSKTIQQGPSLTILPDGSPAIAWQDLRGGAGDRQIMLVFSQDKGDTFSNNFRINNTTANNAFSAPTIVADNEGKIHFVRWDATLSPIGVWYTKIDLGVHFDIPPTPFLDLPWDYQGKGLSFSEAALAINSYFDHEYPLLSTGLLEPDDIINFRGLPRKKLPYSSHDGYDYGNDADARLGDSVLAAASGCASYIRTGAGGNVIKIDHGNGYQSRYLHLLDDGLITNSSSCTQVTKGQQIGKVGYTGNVVPPGEGGAHIHFMVIQDKNNDGNFDDNIPDGVTDPFGWQSTDTDPWPSFAFSYGGQALTGNTSYYLWTKAIANLSQELTANGGFFQLDKFKVDFPNGATNENLDLHLEYGPTFKPSNVLSSIGPSLIINAVNNVGQIIKDVQKPYGIEIDFSTFDLSPFNLGTISVYTSEDGVNWTKEPTQVDLQNKKAGTEVNHMSYFALMAERLDRIAPTTAVNISGSQGQPNWFRSGVQISLNAQDNFGGLGVDYTLYKVDDGDWQQYLNPLQVSAEGLHTVQFYSVDKDENIESIKSTSFNIDKTTPEAKVQFNPSNNKTEITGIDDNGEINITTQNANSYIKKFILSDKAGNTLTLTGIRSETGKNTFIYINSLSYNNGPAINFDFNFFYTYYYLNNLNNLSTLTQSWYDQNDIFISITYKKDTGQSTISIKKPNQSLQKEVRNGLVLLQLITNKGKLEYSY